MEGWSMRNKVQPNNSIVALKKLWGIIHWSLIRHKYLIPTFSIVQGIFAVAIICGMALLIPEIDEVTAVYLSSGALTLDIIAIGCVLAPQIVNESKQNGVFKYQKTLPVSRSIILLSDIIIWGIASLPGILMGCIAAVLRFDVDLQINFGSIMIILISQFSMIYIGFCIAYWFPPNMMALATQVIMIGGLLFSPITYPAERLPRWTEYIYKILPFVPTSDLIRTSFFGGKEISYYDLFIVLLWGILAFLLALCALTKRE